MSHATMPAKTIKVIIPNGETRPTKPVDLSEYKTFSVGFPAAMTSTTLAFILHRDPNEWKDPRDNRVSRFEELPEYQAKETLAIVAGEAVPVETSGLSLLLSSARWVTPEVDSAEGAERELAIFAHR